MKPTKQAKIQNLRKKKRAAAENGLYNSDELAGGDPQSCRKYWVSLAPDNWAGTSHRASIGIIQDLAARSLAVRQAQPQRSDRMKNAASCRISRLCTGIFSLCRVGMREAGSPGGSSGEEEGGPPITSELSGGTASGQSPRSYDARHTRSNGSGSSFRIRRQPSTYGELHDLVAMTKLGNGVVRGLVGK